MTSQTKGTLQSFAFEKRKTQSYYKAQQKSHVYGLIYSSEQRQLMGNEKHMCFETIYLVITVKLNFRKT